MYTCSSAWSFAFSVIMADFFYLNAEFVLKFLTSRCSLTVIMDFVHSYGT